MFNGKLKLRWSGIISRATRAGNLLFALNQMRLFYRTFENGLAVIVIGATILLAGCGQSNTSSTPKTGWVDPNKLSPGPIQHASLTDEQVARATHLQQVFREVDASPLAQWEEDFQRDANPDSELKIWEDMASAYESFTKSRDLSLDAKKDAYQVVILRSAAPEEDVIAHLKLKVLTEKDAREIMAHFSSAPEPIQVVKP